jgi:thiamine biosynthesis protein ThiS
MSKITIFLNGEEILIEKNLKIEDLIRKFNLDTKKIAVEVDLQIINPNDFSKTFLIDGSHVEIVHFIGGG